MRLKQSSVPLRLILVTALIILTGSRKLKIELQVSARIQEGKVWKTILAAF